MVSQETHSSQVLYKEYDNKSKYFLNTISLRLKSAGLRIILGLSPRKLKKVTMGLLPEFISQTLHFQRKEADIEEWIVIRQYRALQKIGLRQS